MSKLLHHLATVGIVVALVLGFGASSMWFLQGSRSFQSCIGGHEQMARDDGEASGQRASASSVAAISRDCAGTFVMEHEPAITALGTMAVALFAIVLAAITARQIILVRDEFRANRRPKFSSQF